MLEQFLKWPKLIWSSIYEKIAESAKKTNTSVKDYLGNEANIDYIGKVVYEGIPFFFKFGLKPEAFDAKFKKHFTAFRDKMFSYDDEVNADKKAEEQSQEAFKSRVESHDDPAQWVELSGSMSKDEVHEKLNDLMHQAKQEGTRVELLKEWKETQKIIQERAKAINDPKQLADMPAFTSDMSNEEISEKFFSMVSEARAKKVNDFNEANNIIMERAQSISEDISGWTRIDADMSREEAISKLLGVNLEEAKRLAKENDEAETKKVSKAKRTRVTTTKAITKTTRKKKIVE